MIEKKVDTDVIRRNIIKLKDNAPKLFCAVVKANAYGHNFDICREIEDLVDFFAVATFKEAMQIKRLKISKRILLLGKSDFAELPNLIKNGIRLTVDALEDVTHIISTATSMQKRAYVHIKINSGMNRLGLKSKCELVKVYDALKACPYVKVEGIYTHFATADNKSSYKLKRQNAKFLSCLSAIPKQDLKNIIVHASNSSAYLKSPKYAYDMVRVGIAMYGYDQVNKVDVTPAMQLRAKIVSVQNVKRGEIVGYDAEYVAPQDMIIAVVSMGYADGFMRAYESGYVLIKGTRCKIVGKICMDMFMCDVTHLCDNLKCAKLSRSKKPEQIRLNLFKETPEYNSHDKLENVVNEKNASLLENCQNVSHEKQNAIKTSCDNSNAINNEEDFLDEETSVSDEPKRLYVNNDTIYKLFYDKTDVATIFMPLEQILQNIFEKVKSQVEKLESTENSTTSNCANKISEDNIENEKKPNINNDIKYEHKNIGANWSKFNHKNNGINASDMMRNKNINNLVGKWATILGQDDNEFLTARDWARLAHTIEYEVLTNFNLARH